MTDLREDDKAARRSAVSVVIQISRQKGLAVAPGTRALLDSWASGELSDDDMVSEMIRRVSVSVSVGGRVS
jgi:hypothetical protein